MKVRLEEPRNLRRKSKTPRRQLLTSDESMPAAKAALMVPVMAKATKRGRSFFDNIEKDTAKASV